MENKSNASVPLVSTEEEEPIESNRGEDKLLEEVAKNTEDKAKHLSGGFEIASIDDIDEDNIIWIEDENGSIVESLSAIPIFDDDIGRICFVLSKKNGLKVIIGFPIEANSAPDNLTLQAHESIQIKCGKAKIELDESGSINIQGTNINSQSYGPNRIKGFPIKVN